MPAIGRAVEEMQGSHKVAVCASVLEIYNETLRDLLSPTRNEKLDIKSVSLNSTL